MEGIVLDRPAMAAAPLIVERPHIQDDEAVGVGKGWIVTVYDNDFNTIEEVIDILMISTGCDLQEAEIETWEIHHLGASVVHHAAEEECRSTAKAIASIGIRVEVSRE